MQEYREQAILHRPLTDAAKSLSRWFERELETIHRTIAFGREHLASHPDDRETRESVQQLEQERAALYRGWENSSVRRAVEACGEKKTAAPGGIEQRVGLAVESRSHLPPEIRADTGTAATLIAKRFSGHAAVFNRWADLGYFKEKIAPGAFAEALKRSDVRFLFNHDANFIFGRSSASTLELREDSVGLAFTCYLLAFDGPSYQLARRIDRKDVSGCSFSFTVKRDEWKFPATPGGIDERTIVEIGGLFDVGPVTYPAYPQTDVIATFEKVERPARASVPRSAPIPTAQGRAVLRDRAFYEELDRLDERIARQRRRQVSYQYGEAARILDRMNVHLLC